MKACIIVCFFGIILFSKAGAGANSPRSFSINAGCFYTSVIHPGVVYNPNYRPAKREVLDSVTKLLRLKLYIDQYNYDDIVIGFNSGASNTYDLNEDSKYFPGINAPEGLASYSGDGIPLSINLLPLPDRQVLVRLDIEAKNSGQITLQKTRLDQLPDKYSVWLVDTYLKDSLDLRANSDYVFAINKADTASFGSYRFYIAVRRTGAAAPAFKLMDFNAAKSGSEAQLAWDTENEADNTRFTVERSSDGGTNFEVLDTLRSASAGNYSCIDKNPPVATDEYRLKITSQSGTVSFSNVVTLIFANSMNRITGNVDIYPNPARTTVNLTFNQTATNTVNDPVSSQKKFIQMSSTPDAAHTPAVYNIQIVNISGSVIKTATSSTATWRENVTGLLPGTYVVTVINASNNKLIGRRTFVKL